MDDALEARHLCATYLARAIRQGGILVPPEQRADSAEVGHLIHALQQFLDARV